MNLKNATGYHTDAKCCHAGAKRLDYAGLRFSLHHGRLEQPSRLKVSRRTLQDYRNNGIIAYYQLGGKILYKESDIESMLAANYREAFR